MYLLDTNVVSEYRSQIAAIALMCKEPMTVVTRDRNSPGFLAAINYGLMLFNPFT